MPNIEEGAPCGLRPELVQDLVDRIDRQFAAYAVSHVLGKLPRHICEAPWFERCRAARAAERRATEQGGTR